ncbi:MAG: hypothetical protein ACYC5M_12685 [Anaerolineae bacterium]
MSRKTYRIVRLDPYTGAPDQEQLDMLADSELEAWVMALTSANYRVLDCRFVRGALEGALIRELSTDRYWLLRCEEG